MDRLIIGLPQPFRASTSPAPPSDKPGEALGEVMAMAMLANHYITFSISAKRIENATGEVSDDKRRVTWRIPIMLLVKPPSGYRQDIRADIIYDESLMDRALRFHAWD
jgi:hypothetical protein